MAANTSDSDDQLLQRMMSGEEEAFVTLYRRRQGEIYRFALHMSGSKSAAEDVTQEVFMVLMQEGHRYESNRGSVAAYLYGIARNHVLRHLRRQQGSSQLTDDIEDLEARSDWSSTPQTDPLVELTRKQTVEVVQQAVLSLPAHYREVVVLCELQEMSYAEAAVALDCAIGTVRSRLHRARGLLAQRLPREGKFAERRCEGNEEDVNSARVGSATTPAIANSASNEDADRAPQSVGKENITRCFA